MWTIGLSIYSLLSYAIDNINTYYALYNYLYFYHFYNISRIVFNILMLIILWKSINQCHILQERRFLKMWVVFPICIALDQIISNLFYFINVNFIISYYLSFPLSILINIVMLIYIHSYFRNKNILIIIYINIIYAIFSFLYSIYFPTITNLTTLYTLLFSTVNVIKTYLVSNILSMIFVILCIGGNNYE